MGIQQKLKIIFFILFLCLVSNGCGNKTTLSNKNNISVAQEKSNPNLEQNRKINTNVAQSTYKETENSLIVSLTDKNIKPMNEDDFIVSDGNNIINLDFPFKNFKINKKEKTIENNYVGETYLGEYIYKTYFHEYDDFDLYVSNLNYNVKNRNFDEYYITQITLKSSNFKTTRNQYWC